MQPVAPGPTNTKNAPVGDGHLQDLIRERMVRGIPILPIFGLPAPLQVMTTVLRFIRGRRCRTIGDGEVFGVAYLQAQPVYLHPLMGTTARRAIWTPRITVRKISATG